MTTGRINQVTTLAPHKQTTTWSSSLSGPRNRSETERTRSDCRSHVVQCEPKHLSQTEILAQRPASSYLKVATLIHQTTIALRLPNTPCEVGIHKTVELVLKLYLAETSVPDLRYTNTADVPPPKICCCETDRQIRLVSHISQPGIFYNARVAMEVSASSPSCEFHFDDQLKRRRSVPSDAPQLPLPRITIVTSSNSTQQLHSVITAQLTFPPRTHPIYILYTV